MSVGLKTAHYDRRSFFFLPVVYTLLQHYYIVLCLCDPRLHVVKYKSNIEDLKTYYRVSLVENDQNTFFSEEKPLKSTFYPVSECRYIISGLLWTEYLIEKYFALISKFSGQYFFFSPEYYSKLKVRTHTHTHTMQHITQYDKTYWNLHSDRIM